MTPRTRAAVRLPEPTPAPPLPLAPAAPAPAVSGVRAADAAPLRRPRRASAPLRAAAGPRRRYVSDDAPRAAQPPAPRRPPPRRRLCNRQHTDLLYHTPPRAPPRPAPGRCHWPSSGSARCRLGRRGRPSRRGAAGMRAMSPAPRSPDLLTHIPPRRRRTLPARPLRCCLHSTAPPHLTTARLSLPAARRGAGDARRPAVRCR